MGQKDAVVVLSKPNEKEELNMTNRDLIGDERG